MFTLHFKRVLLSTVLVVFCFEELYSQQNPTMDNYLFNPVSISPAYAGLQNGHVQSIYDAQWIGLKGAPRTGSMYVDYMSPKRFAINLGFVDDQVGPLHMQNLGLSTAYHLQVQENLFISAGIRYTLNQSSVDIIDEFYLDKIDQSIFNIDGPLFQNVDLSGSIYSRKWYAGATFKNIVVHEIYKSNYSARVGHVFGGYKHSVNDDWNLSVSGLLNVTENAPADMNYHLFVEYSEEIGIGTNFSPNDEIGMFLKARLSDSYLFFYQYNYPLSDLIYVTNQSHVIGIGIDLIPDAKTIVSPRYFL